MLSFRNSLFYNLQSTRQRSGMVNMLSQQWWEIVLFDVTYRSHFLKTKVR